MEKSASRVLVIIFLGAGVHLAFIWRSFLLWPFLIR